jgi:glucose-6-phosphate isomerase
MTNKVFDVPPMTKRRLQNGLRKLARYRAKLGAFSVAALKTRPEYALLYPAADELHALARDLRERSRLIKTVLLIGSGGSSLGAEAIDAALPRKRARLIVIDTVSPSMVSEAVSQLSAGREARQVAVCVVSKSGTTMETLANASVTLRALHRRFGDALYRQCYFIGASDSPLLAAARALKANAISMPDSISGRYSVGTEAGVVPLALLGHDVESFLVGLKDANESENEDLAAERAAWLYGYLTAGYCHYDFFAFAPSLAKLGAWYRQLLCESAGKKTTRRGKKMTRYFAPTVSTPADLHSTAQLYQSGLLKLVTDFVSFDETMGDEKIGPSRLASKLAHVTLSQTARALYHSTLGAYSQVALPHRVTTFAADRLPLELGRFVGLRMRETIYLCELLDVDAFTQPQVERYKKLAWKAILRA